jgi:hypothetical protein
MPTLKSMSGTTLLSLDGNRLLISMSQVIGEARGNALFNLHGQQLMEAGNGQICREEGRPLLSARGSQVFSLSGEPLATVEAALSTNRRCLARPASRFVRSDRDVRLTESKEFGDHFAMPVSASQRLKTIKLVHTLAWALFAGCIIAIPIATLLSEHRVAAWLAGIVFVEILVLAFNQWSCPLTSIAARYTEDRRPNFDIYLPQWLAKYNKQIFGPLYIAGMLFALANWLHAATSR